MKKPMSRLLDNGDTYDYVWDSNKKLRYKHIL